MPLRINCFAIIAHDLRSPFNNIFKHYAKILNIAIKKSEVESSEKYLGLIDF